MTEFVAQSNGDYIVKFSAMRPFTMNKRIRFEGHEVRSLGQKDVFLIVLMSSYFLFYTLLNSYDVPLKPGQLFSAFI